MKSRNISKKYGYHQPESGDLPKGAGGGDHAGEGAQENEDDDSNNNPKGVYLTNEQFASLMKQNSNEKNNAKSVFDTIDDQRKIDDEKNRDDSEFKKAVIYNTSVTRYIDDNKQHFSSDVLKAVELISSDEKDEIQLEKLLKATIAKDFFRIEENLNMLPADKRAFVADNIRVPEKYLIDKADQLNDLMSIAMFYAQEKAKREFSNDQNAAGASTSPKSLAYVEKMKRKAKVTA